MASMVNTIIARAAPLLNIRVNPKKSYASEKYVTVANIKNKMKERSSAAKILSNIDREIDMMKIELTEEIKSLSAS